MAFGLSGLEEISAIAGLIALSEDTDFDTRNWATFGLGSQCDTDTVELRRALLRRTDDDEAEIRGEALIGLARRKDERVKKLVIRELSEKFHGNWAVEAAEIFPNRAYLPLLTGLLRRLAKEDRTYFADSINSALHSALAACQKI